MNITIIDHPLVKHKLTLMREAESSTYKFRALAKELARLMAYEASRDFETENYILDGWCGDIEGQRIKGKTLTVVPILRAGLGMLDGVLDLIPTAKISVVGLQRDEETLQPVSYFEKLVDSMNERPALILDPMLATGGSAVQAVDVVKAAGGREIVFVCIVASPEGVEAVRKTHPDTHVYVAAVDRALDARKYILPGLGDFGDRLYGT